MIERDDLSMGFGSGVWETSCGVCTSLERRRYVSLYDCTQPRAPHGRGYLPAPHRDTLRYLANPQLGQSKRQQTQPFFLTSISIPQISSSAPRSARMPPYAIFLLVLYYARMGKKVRGACFLHISGVISFAPSALFCSHLWVYVFIPRDTYVRNTLDEMVVWGWGAACLLACLLL